MTQSLRISQLILAGAGVLAAVGCKPKSEGEVVSKSASGTQVAESPAAADRHDNVLVRVINATPGTVDVWADSEKAFSSVSAKHTTDYREFHDNNSITFRLRRVGQPSSTDPIATNHEIVNDGSYHTIVVVPGDSGKSMDLRIVADEQKPVEAGKARVRVIHAARDAGEIDVVAPGQKDPVFGGVNFEHEAGYKDVDPVTGSLQVRRQDGKGAAATIPNSKLVAGKTYTIVVTNAGHSAGALQGITVTDEIGTSSAGANRPAMTDTTKH